MTQTLEWDTPPTPFPPLSWCGSSDWQKQDRWWLDPHSNHTYLKQNGKLSRGHTHPILSLHPNGVLLFSLTVSCSGWSKFCHSSERVTSVLLVSEMGGLWETLKVESIPPPPVSNEYRITCVQMMMMRDTLLIPNSVLSSRDVWEWNCFKDRIRYTYNESKSNFIHIQSRKYIYH